MVSLSSKFQFLYGTKPVFVRRPFWTAPGLPEFISDCGDLLLIGFRSDHVDALPGPGLLMLLWQVQVGLIGVLKSLSGSFMSSQVIFLSVLHGPSEMGVGSKVLVLGSDLL